MGSRGGKGWRGGVRDKAERGGGVEGRGRGWSVASNRCAQRPQGTKALVITSNGIYFSLLLCFATLRCYVSVLFPLCVALCWRSTCCANVLGKLEEKGRGVGINLQA